MKIMTFNVNGLRARFHQLEAIVQQLCPDIIGLQETKVQDCDFPVEFINNLGYEVFFHGQKSHYGVATLSRLPMQLVSTGFATDTEDEQCRTLITTHMVNQLEITVFNGYFPQGERDTHPTKFPAKKAYYESLITFCQQRSNHATFLIGDFNIAPHDEDVGVENPQQWLDAGACSFLPEERAWYQRLLNTGFADTWHQINPDDRKIRQMFSHFDYRTRGFERTVKRGLRIDHILTSLDLLDRVDSVDIDYAIRKMQKPSDHAPVWAKLKL